MSTKEQLRNQHKGLILNIKSSKQDKDIKTAVKQIEMNLCKSFNGLRLLFDVEWKLIDIINNLKKQHTSVDFVCYSDKSSMRPDGGILSIVDSLNIKYPILISERKNQGTNDIRLIEGKKLQVKGNAIERLGKNVIGFRTALSHESIFPFVCFGDGCDFCEGSTILDRVITIAQFGELNKEHLYNEGLNNIISRGTFYFREENWTFKEIFELSYSIAIQSVEYYINKYGLKKFTDDIVIK